MRARQVYAALVVFVTLLVAAVGNWAYIRHVDEQSDQRSVQRSREICGLIRLIDDRNQTLPPTSDKDTADFRAELHRYRVALGC